MWMENHLWGFAVPFAFYTDKPLDKSTVYTVKWLMLTPSNWAWQTEDFSFRFYDKNRNRLSLITSNPFSANNGVHYQTPSIRLIFDRKLNTTNSDKSKCVGRKWNCPCKNSRSFVNNSIMAPYGSIYFMYRPTWLQEKNIHLLWMAIWLMRLGWEGCWTLEISLKQSMQW